MCHFWAQNGPFALQNHAPNTMLSLKNTKEPILRKLTDRRKEGRTDRPYFIGPFRPRPGVQKTCNAIDCNIFIVVFIFT